MPQLSSYNIFVKQYAARARARGIPFTMKQAAAAWKQRGGAKQSNVPEGGYPTRADYEAAVYKKSNEVVGKLHRKYGANILKMAQNAAVALINMLKENKVINTYNKIYAKKRNGAVYISGTISYSKVALTDATDAASWVAANLKNIRSCLTFTDLAVKLLGTKSDRINGLVNIFDNTVRQRVKDKIDTDLCIKDFRVPFTYDNSKEQQNCVPMMDLYEDYSESEHFVDQEKIPTIVSSGSVIFAEENPKDTVGVFAAGTSGHTFDTLLLFILFFLDNDEALENGTHPLLNYIGMGCLIWMINYYHHSFREIALPVTLFGTQELRTNVEFLFAKLSNPEEGLAALDYIYSILDTTPLDVDLNINYTQGAKNFTDLISGQTNPQLDRRMNLIYNSISNYRTRNINKAAFNIPNPYQF